MWWPRQEVCKFKARLCNTMNLRSAWATQLQETNENTISYKTTQNCNFQLHDFKIYYKMIINQIDKATYTYQ
jgi:LEA14-like dessication related protein